MHELDAAAAIEKHKEKIRELEAWARQRGDDQVSYSTELLKKLAEATDLPQELLDYHCRSMKELDDRDKKMKKFKEENPDLSPEEFLQQFWPSRQLSTEETVKFYEDTVYSGQLLKFLLENRHLLENNSSISEKLHKKLFPKINKKEDMGIVHAIADSIYHLGEILRTMEAKNLYGIYEAKGSAQNSLGETITLEYSFRASSESEAQKELEEYKNTMLKKGLRTWMAYWCSANEKDSVEYKCSLTEVMKWTADEDREAPFSQKEREEFWCLTRMLGNTKLLRSKIGIKRTKGKEKEVIQWIEQPLVQVFGGERLLEDEEKCPISIVIRVLRPNFGSKGFAPSLYSKSTTKLPPNEFLLAYMVQTRAAQMERDPKRDNYDPSFSWEYLFELGHLQKSSISNPRQAKATMQQRLSTLKESQIIETFDKCPTGMIMHAKKREKKHPPKKKKIGRTP